MTTSIWEQIAEAALAVADERGAAGFTMRAVAETIGVTPMALYHYVEDKAALVALVVDASIAENPLPPPTGSWREDLFEMARWMRQTTLAHPAVARPRSAYNVWTPSIFPMTERWLSVWQQSGLELSVAMIAASASSTAIIGFVEAELLYAKTTFPDDSALSSFPSARLAFNLERDGTREFELVVRSILDGLHARLAPGDPSAATSEQRAARARSTRSSPPGPPGPKRAASRGRRGGA